MRRSRSRVRCLTRRRKRPYSRCSTHQGSCGSICRTIKGGNDESRSFADRSCRYRVHPVGAGARSSVRRDRRPRDSPLSVPWRDRQWGVAITGVATSFICTNFSGVAENFRIVVRDAGGGVVVNRATSNIPHLVTVTWSTHDTNLLIDSNLLTGAVAQGTAAIAATSTSVVCTAMIIDAASSSSPQGIELHGIRLSPIPGTQE